MSPRPVRPTQKHPDPAPGTWRDSVETDESLTAAHCARVAELAERLALELGLEVRAVECARLGAELHDIGKVGVPDSILEKPASLSPAEWSIMRRHPEWGAQVARDLRMPEPVTEAIRHHHEHWDGGGYPDGLAGERIPLLARLICIVDVYDALTSDRSYRPALCRSDALRMMQSESGATLDPSLFAEFRRIVEGDGPAPAA